MPQYVKAKLIYCGKLYVICGRKTNAIDYEKQQKAIAEYMDNQYTIKSNRKSGDGRYDIGLFPRDNRYPGIIMELKWKKGLRADELSRRADEALVQIEEKRYDAEMKEAESKCQNKIQIIAKNKKVLKRL